MTTSRNIRSVQKSVPTLEGAGVHLRRAFGNNSDNVFDPFLLLDDFRSDVPSHYLKGFPWHPHRGIETITYVTKGDVEHGDSMGNKGIISSGDVQWMTAGSGIIHQEMPKGDKNGAMDGFQLWANLPASHKMMPPRYRDVKSGRIPEVKLENGVKIRIICGTVDKTSGPVKDIVTDPEYLDVSIPPYAGFIHSVKRGHTVFAYVFEGSGFFDPRQESPADNGSIILFDDGDQVTVSTGKNPVRFLLVSGKPLGEPVAWYGPIVMNTDEELRIAFEEYENGTFIKQDTKKGKRSRKG
jgi:redox-sensitive bicupin YhaK (pirin superfamily)